MRYTVLIDFISNDIGVLLSSYDPMGKKARKVLLDRGYIAFSNSGVFLDTVDDYLDNRYSDLEIKKILMKERKEFEDVYRDVARVFHKKLEKMFLTGKADWM